ncbi:LysR family transcriptional regulator [Henriciella aquimarina]|uniref:LysR family transcriptional regulator n=1 Tax=Henriciella aquimarina TaxID=545261 RepID=UPI0009FFDE87|nr:LysR family transcriptional regulator [Henriciella aquimarina]
MDRNWQGLEELVAVGDTGSFVGASRLLGVSTSHVSRAVAALEDRVMVPLFFRTTRTVRPTHAGEELIVRARRLIQERDAALALVRGDDEPQGELCITCSVSLGERYVAPITRRFAEQYPRISIRLDLSNRLVDLIGEGYDLGIRTGHIGDSRLIGQQVGTRRFLLCAAPSYLAAHGQPSSIADLQEHVCLIGNSAHWHFRNDDGPVTYEPAGRWRCSSSAAILDATVAGMGICQLPMLYVASFLRDGSLVRLLPENEEAPEPIWAIYPRRMHTLPKVEEMISRLVSDLPGELNAPV